jgi:Ca-activated chloride channel family protein
MFAGTREFSWPLVRLSIAATFPARAASGNVQPSKHDNAAQIEEHDMKPSWRSIAVCAVATLVAGGCAEESKEFAVKSKMTATMAKEAAAPERPDRAGHVWQPAPVPPASVAREQVATRVTQEPVVPPGSPSNAAAAANRGFNTETYDAIVENPFLSAKQNPLSTFSIDVDTASYALVRRFLKQGLLPPSGAVRIEELVNYFPYHYAKPTGDVPFSVNVELADCPWNANHRLARIGLKGRDVHQNERPASNLVFLLDVSGSMSDENKLPLVKTSLKMLLERLGENDRVAIVVYAGESGLVLPSTSAFDRSKIVAAIDSLVARGSTNAGEGIQLAYQVAAENFITGGVNRIILCTDGDFNVGVTDQGELVRMIEEKARGGVFLTVLGFGMGNYKDSTMEKLADKGNGNYAYIDTVSEAKKVLVHQLSGALVTIAKDVKIQIDFNPARAAGYRLIGYENRLLRSEDFKNDAKDAGEIGAGHTVTAFYEIVPAGLPIPGSDVDPSKYQTHANLTNAAEGPELLTVRLRYKEPDGKTSKPLEVPVVDRRMPFDSASDDYRFAASVAEFGMLLRDSRYRGDMSFQGVLEIASASIGPDKRGYRAEFLELAKAARNLKQPLRKEVAGTASADTDRLPANELNRRSMTRPERARPRPAETTSQPFEETNASGVFSTDHLLRLVVLCLLAWLLLGLERWRSRQICESERWQEPHSM